MKNYAGTLEFRKRDQRPFYCIPVCGKQLSDLPRTLEWAIVAHERMPVKILEPGGSGTNAATDSGAQLRDTLWAAFGVVLGQA